MFHMSIMWGHSQRAQVGADAGTGSPISAFLQTCDYIPPLYSPLYVMRADIPHASAARNKFSCHRFTALTYLHTWNRRTLGRSNRAQQRGGSVAAAGAVGAVLRAAVLPPVL